MKLMDDYPERVVVSFAFWPFVSLLKSTLVRARAAPITHPRRHPSHSRYHSTSSTAPITFTAARPALRALCGW